MGSNQEQLAQIASEVETSVGPILVVECLKFHERAAYAPEHAPVSEPLTGQEAYLTFVSYVSGLMIGFGVTAAASESSHEPFVDDDGEPWDMRIAARYPNRAALLDMLSSPLYQAIRHHRTAAVAHSRLNITEVHG
ncbi:MAG: DUF1330 domain-containing protein [Ilumatobacter sp.]